MKKKTAKKDKPRIGRPPKAVKEINKTRQVGRWTDENWEKIREAASARGENIAEFAKRVMLREAKKGSKK